MSAIAGIVHFNKQPVLVEHSKSLIKSLQEFPADDIQVWSKDNVFLGCLAQWITPESIGEKLPYYDYETQCTITADAIIDNRDELFERLQVKREDRKTITDSRLILLSYYKWGEKAPEFLVGDFAFMIWDANKNRLFGARDFSGSRTLYYIRNQQHVAFSTLIKPLFTLPFVEKQLNENWLADFLAIPDMIDSAEPATTIYKNIAQIPPSHIILIEESNVTLKKFRVIDFEKKLRFKSNGEYEEALREVLQIAVNEKIRTHKNVGAQLSGGLDSSTVAGFAVNTLRKENKKLYSFSYIPTEDFNDFTPQYRIADERPYINSIVNHLGNIDAKYLDCDGKSPLTEIDDWLEIMEMPYKFFENSFWLRETYVKANDYGVGVLLNGAGGNFTISWGPAIEYYSILLKKCRWIKLQHEIKLHSKNTGAGRKRIFSAIRKNTLQSIFTNFKSGNSFQFPIIINEKFAKDLNIIEKLQQYNIDITNSSNINGYEARKEWFLREYFRNASGTAATKLSLRYALWNRDPTNDVRVIQFCLAVPENQYVQNGFNRSLIRRTTKNLLPDKVRLNQRIRGIQGADWVHRIMPSWKPYMEELHHMVQDPIISSFLNIELLKNLLVKFESNPRSDYAFDPEFRVIMRSLIFYRFIKNLT
ncbi:asparagine synthase-related protein [Neobacillus mesonae]|uniref:asparagine synthase-related protein n=1 Tax=Neobacillus mesonae TaxID=1193713 RepID=UPI00203CBB3F|nr:asparagine synthase-related protein [Neobacillus mesonae]MCM3568200.1 asparagine synthase-related protein [Neobacillus mesonae]